MHVVILGAGQVGSNLAKTLVQEKHDVVIIDHNPDKIEAVVDQLDVMGLVGNGVSLPVLKQAEVERAELFIAVTRNDEINILGCIFAKEFGVPKKVARIRDESFSHYSKNLSLEKLGIDFIIHPEKAAAENVVTLIRQTSATDVLEVGGGTMEIIGLKVDNAFKHANKMLQDSIPEGELHYRTIAIKRKNQTIVPHGRDIFMKNDQVYFLVDSAHKKGVLEYFGKAPKKLHNVMILGAGRIGRMIAAKLQGMMNVKIIDKDPEHSQQAAETLEKTLIIHGDGTDYDLLIREGMMEMDVFVAATSDDETNFIVTLLAKHLQVPRAIAIVNNAYYMPITPTIGLDAAVSPQTLVVNQITKYARSQKIASIATIPGVDAEAIDIVAEEDSAITRKPLKDLDFPRGAILGGVIHEKRVIIAEGNTQIETGDRVILFCLPHTISKVESMFRGKR
jgi:trk system potassium uptake protein TrkA